ncbi:MAG: DUF4394 domain-containing protein [Bacteroidetes bacterium]|nr:DUF4394 domain-containing protein [Bacteroidota bacterium]
MNLTTGAATLIGSIGLPVQDIACYISRSVPSQITGEWVYAITAGNMLIGFDSNLPSIIRMAYPITGVTVGQTLVGFDSRPNTGQLYALGYNSTTNESQLYTINRNTGAATVVNASPVILALGTGKVSFDFNPTVDRIRVTSSNNANYRLVPTTGAIAATDLNQNYAAGDPNAGTDPSVGTVAYTNSYIASTSTILYVYDDSLNILATQIPPNNGTLNTIGSSGISVNLADPSSDMDIAFNTNSLTNIAFISANTGASANDGFYTMNLSTGAALLVGGIGYGIAVRDISVFINRTIPSTYTGELVYAHTSSNFLVGFDSDVPTIIRAAVPVTGLTVGQSLVGMDFRPANKLLYGLGYNSTNGESQLYTINRQTGLATVVNSTPVVLALGTGDIGFDFNPTVDRIRVVGANNANYRLIPTTGAIAATDANLAYAGSDINFGVDPTIGAIAYTNSFSGSTTTTLYDYDNSLNILATQIPPNNGTLNTVGSSGIVLNGADATADMDIYYDMSSSSNSAYLSANTGSSNFDDFYSLNLATGAANIIGKIGFGVAVRDIALFPTAVNMMRTNTEERMASNSIYEPENNIRLFPNPVNEATRISFSAIDGENIKINVSDISGRELKVITQQTYNGGNHQISWNATDLKAGIYFLNLYTDNNKSQTIKFLVR